MSRPTVNLLILLAAIAVVAGCQSEPAQPATTTSVPPVTSLPPVDISVSPSTTTTSTTTTTTLPPRFGVTVAVADASGVPVAAAVVTIGSDQAITGPDGTVSFTDIEPATISLNRHGWLPATIDWDGTEDQIAAVLEPRVVRGLRVSSYVAADREQFDNLLELASGSSVNSLVFDTKDETGYVLYESDSEFAAGIGSVNPMYEPTELIAAAAAADLYTITRIVTFEDSRWVRERPEHKLAGNWIDPTNIEAWEYPLQLATEACEIGFDEIQFDYVRFPAGRTATAAQKARPTTQEERVTAIAGFLAEARARLHPLGCALSADIFGIVLSSSNDQGIGQIPEAISGSVDAISPMIYPSHYSAGWLGFDEPNDHPGAVVADALDSGMPRLSGNTQMRPWLQAFYYTGSQIREEIAAAEDRGIGWILWNAVSNYSAASLPPSDE